MTTPLTQRAAEGASAWLSARTSRRGFLARSAVVGSALMVNGWAYLLKPQSAYAAVCGPGSSCSSGWTVFCATINKGVNACPPGSVAAGWWKADGASLCGGKARYIVDCNATCSRCTTGSSRPGICASGCWSCRCGCGPAGQCDNRRVCCNAFRYGQCNQQIHQVGAVHCRVVSCVPPWTFANCTKAVATDNRTRDHNSPALPSAWSAITARYVQLGDLTSVLGPSVNGEFAVANGHAQRYVNGRMSWRSGIGAFYTQGAVLARYLALNGEGGALGYPLADMIPIGRGAAARFQHGRISWHPTTGAHETLGPIATRYAAAGNEPGRLGYPLGSVLPADGQGRANTFQRGRISWHPSTGARLLGAPIAARYGVLGAEGGPLGYPVTDEAAVTGAIANAAFQHGRIAWSELTGAVEVLLPLATAYARAGNETGVLGLPIAAAAAAAAGRAQRFQRGRISAGPPGVFFTLGPIAERYVASGAESGSLGWPTTDDYAPATGLRRTDFQFGTIEYDESTGITTITGPGTP